MDKKICITGTHRRTFIKKMIANLHIQTALRDNITYLKQVYYTPPFKVANITEDKMSGQLELMLMSSSPGILDGDEYHIKIDMEQDCSLQLQTQSYQRLFNMKKGAVQNTDVHLAENAAFYFIPHPSVPHEESVFTAKNKIYLTDNCSLIFGDILTCGRKMNGEVFMFSKFHNLTEIFLNNKLIIKENLLIEPLNINVNSIGQLEGYTHQATLIFLNGNTSMKIVTAALNEMLMQYKEILFGVTAAPVNGVIVRILGQKAEQLFDCLKKISSVLQNNYIHSTSEYAGWNGDIDICGRISSVFAYYYRAGSLYAFHCPV